MLLSWIFRGFLIAAGFVASWFVAKDAPQFGIMQMAVVANSCSGYRGATGILAKTVGSHFESPS
jgi:hypothetical protein